MRRVNAKKTKRRPGPVGTNIKRLRDEHDLSQKALADKAGVHPITISKLETGVSQDPDMPTIRAIADALKVDVSEITETRVESAPELIEVYLRSPWASIDKPTDGELAWFRSLPGVVFRGVAASAEAVHHLLMARRSK